jgi:hypothetical protein
MCDKLNLLVNAKLHVLDYVVAIVFKTNGVLKMMAVAVLVIL